MNKKLVTATMFLAMTAALLLSSPAAHADSFTLVLDTPSQAGSLGDTLSFSGTIKADAGNTGDLTFGADIFNLDLSLTTDDSGYVSSPVTFSPGDVYTGPLFTVTFGPGVVPGDYLGSFTVDATDLNGLDVPQTVFFTASAVPEPASLLLLATGAVGALGAFRKRR